jgi:hypothetical protein
MPVAKESTLNLIWFKNIVTNKTTHAILPETIASTLTDGEKMRGMCHDVIWSKSLSIITDEPTHKCKGCQKAILRHLYTPSEVCVRAGRILNKVYGGLHHVEEIEDYDYYASVSVSGGLASFDFNHLTQLVIAAHDDCLRLEIDCAGPGRLKLMFHRRRREGGISERHPTLDQALETIRESHGQYDRGWDKYGPLDIVQFVKGHSRPVRER